jgi:hypothetical protein
MRAQITLDLWHWLGTDALKHLESQEYWLRPLMRNQDAPPTFMLAG